MSIEISDNGELGITGGRIAPRNALPVVQGSTVYVPVTYTSGMSGLTEKRTHQCWLVLGPDTKQLPFYDVEVGIASLRIVESLPTPDAIAQEVAEAFERLPAPTPALETFERLPADWKPASANFVRMVP